jgi:AraC-like DNA-binding protein
MFYVCKIGGYVALFFNHYHRYEQRMADYFSDDEHRRLQWVRRSVFMALVVGVLALFYAFFSSWPSLSMILSVVFTLVMTTYYAVFAIRFVNYAFSFQQIEAAMLDEPMPPTVSGKTETHASAGSSLAPSSPCNTAPRLMGKLDDLMAEKRLYAKPDLTIEELAVLAGESHRTVSAAINSCRKTNFKAWVNAYRIGEAQRLIGEGFLENYTTDALAKAVGFANRISFYRVFKKATGHSPSEY